MDGDGNTPLHIASRHNHIRCAESLVRANAPLAVRNGDGKTPMDVASGQSKTFLEQYFEKNKRSVQNAYDGVIAQAKKRYSGSHYISRVFVLVRFGAFPSSPHPSLFPPVYTALRS